MRHPRVGRNAGDILHHVCPILPAILRHVHIAVVRPDPEHAPLYRTWRNGHDRGVVFSGRHIFGESAAFILLLLRRVVGRQIRTDDFPHLAAVGALVDELAAVVDRLLVERVCGDAGVPVEAQVNAVRPPRANTFPLAGLPVEANQRAALGHGVAVGGVGGIDQRGKAVAEADFVPVPVTDAAVLPHVARPAPRAVILHASEHIVGRLHIDVDMIELAEGQVVHEPPGAAVIAAEVHPAVAAVDEIAAVVGMNPERVVVGVDAVLSAQRAECFPSILADLQVRVQAVEAVFVLGVDADVAVVERAWCDVRRVVDHAPGFAAVVGPIQSVLRCLDERVDDVGVVLCNRDPQAAEVAFWQPLFVSEFFPRLSAIVRYVQSTARSA